MRPYEEMSKLELQAEAERRGLDTRAKNASLLRKELVKLDSLGLRGVIRASPVVSIVFLLTVVAIFLLLVPIGLDLNLLRWFLVVVLLFDLLTVRAYIRVTTRRRL